MVGFKEFLYGLGTAGDTFTKIMLRAQERAQDHERQKELLGIRKGPALRSGMSAGDERAMERSYRDENEILADDFASKVGSSKRVPIRSGDLPTDEAARGRKTTSLPADYRPAPRQGAAFDTSQRGVRPDDASIMVGPGNSLMRGSFGEAMSGASPAAREAMFPSSMLDAEIAASPFARAMKSAGNEAAAAKAKSTLASVSASRQSGAQTMDRLAPLDPAAQVAASEMGLVGRSLREGRDAYRQEGITDARTKARDAATIGVDAAEKKAKKGSEIILGRTTTIAQRKGITALADQMISRGDTPTPESIVAASKGLYTTEQAADALKNATPTVQAAGENETAAARKNAITDARKSQNQIRSAIKKDGYASAENLAALEAVYDVLESKGAMTPAERDVQRRKDAPVTTPAKATTGAAPAKATKAEPAKKKVTLDDVRREVAKYGDASPKTKVAVAETLGISVQELDALLPD